MNTLGVLLMMLRRKIGDNASIMRRVGEYNIIRGTELRYHRACKWRNFANFPKLCVTPPDSTGCTRN